MLNEALKLSARYHGYLYIQPDPSQTFYSSKLIIIASQTVKFVLCAGNTHFSCADAAYVAMRTCSRRLCLLTHFMIAITCAAATKIYICVAKNLGNCAESLNADKSAQGIYSLRRLNFTVWLPALTLTSKTCHSGYLYTHIFPLQVALLSF